MRSHGLLAVLCLVAAGAVGCGSEQVADGGGSSTEPGPVPARMREVADAWHGTDATREWREGYFPLEEPVQLPTGGPHEGEAEEAYRSGSLVLSGTVPQEPREGRIRWEDGEPLEVAVMPAAEAYGLLDSGADGEEQGRPTLTVTGAELGEMRLLTSRGPARVPAWLFTVEGYDTPLKQAAVQPPEPPRVQVGEPENPGGLRQLLGLRSVSEGSRAVTLLAGHGACDDGPAVQVLETDESVVFAGSVVGAEDGPCTEQLLTDPVTVELDRPLGSRLPLDALTGELLRPVPPQPHSVP